MSFIENIKIIHGTCEVAKQNYLSTKGLQYNGYFAKSIICDTNFFNNKFTYDYVIIKNKSFLKYIFFAIIIFFKFNIFHFHFGHSLFRRLELPFYKLFSKKIFFEFHGSDLRNYNEFCKKNSIVLKGKKFENSNALKNVNRICKYADGIILHDNELIEYLPKTYEKVYVVPLRINFDEIIPNYLQNKRILIVHSPSNREIKGTEHVLNAIKVLKNKYDFDFKLIENMTNEEAMKVYSSADIIIDQLIIGTYGVLSIEAMALGKPVITYISDDMIKTLPTDLPIHNANIYNIKNRIEELIIDSNLRKELGIKGRKYVERYHDYRKNSKMLYDIYSGKIKYLNGRDSFDYVSNISLNEK